jgi:proline racemase
VSFENVPAFVFAQGVEVDTSGAGLVSADIAFGGAFYAFVDAPGLALAVEPSSVTALAELGMEIKYRIMDKLQVVHPLEPELNGIYGTIFTQPISKAPEGLKSKNCCIFADTQIDRSPTGTGTSARLALMAAGGQIAPGQKFINKSIINTEFWGRVTGQTTVDRFAAVITEVGGTAHTMGYSRLVLEPGDPLPQGLRLSGG